MSSFDDEEVSILGSTQNGDSEENALSFNDSDFYLNMDDVDIGPQIGQGAFSKVYLGRYLGELVAVKKQARRDSDLEAYLMRELAVLKHFQHENLLQYVGASNAESVEPGGLGHVFIVTELACGGDLLAMLLSEGQVGWKLRVSILTDAARALEFLHRKGLIHRDIKSPNILLDSQHRCKIADFGMARQIGTDMTVVGTDAYMAPELMFDSPYGTSADMFSFGIVLWETIYRQKAGSEDFIERRMADRFELDVQTLQEDAPPDTNPSLVELAAQLVQYEPDERPTAEDTLLWLEDLCDALPDDLEPPRTPIDYESLFPLEMGERNPQRRGNSSKNMAKTKSTAVVKFSGTHGGVTPVGMTMGPGNDESMFSSINPMSPVILPSGRRATVGMAGAGFASKFMERSGGELLGMKKAKSMQDCLTNAPRKSSRANGERRRASDGLDEPKLNIKNNTFVKNYNTYYKSGPPGGDYRDHHPPLCSDVQSELCTRYLFVCMQGGLTAGKMRNRSGGDINGGGGGFGVGRMEAGWRQGRSPVGSPGAGAGGGRGTSNFRAIGASHAPITRQGYLYKKGKRGLRNWQRRWFVLEGSKLIWYKDSKSYPREPRGYLELKGCFLVKGSAQRWKILSADATAEQDDYNREISAKSVQDMEGWLKSLQEAIDGADTGEGPEGIMLPVLRGEENELDRHLYNATTESYRVDMSVVEWLDSLGLSSLTGMFLSADYSDFLVIQEMGLTDEDLAYVGVKDAAQRKALKLGAKGLVEPLLQVDISGFFNFHSEPVYRVDSKWRYLQASTYFEYSEFDDLHRRLKTAMKDTKFYKMMPTLPQRPNSKIGTNDHARQMARVQQNLNGYMQKLVMLVGAKEPYFTVLCEMLDLLPPDPHRLPVREDDFLAQIQSRIDRQRMGAVAGSGGGQAASAAATAGGGGGGGRGMEGGGVVVNGGDPAKSASNQRTFSGVNGKGLPLSSLSASAASSPSVIVKRQPYSGMGSGGNDPTNSLHLGRPRSLGSSGTGQSKGKGKSLLPLGGGEGSESSLGVEAGRAEGGVSSASTSAS